MTFRNIRPVHILWQKGIEVEMLSGVFSGVARTLVLAKVLHEFKLQHLGQRRQPNWLRPDGTPAANQSLDWHIELARLHSKEAGYLNSTMLLNSLRENPTNQTEPKYELAVVNEQLHWSDDSLREVGGVGRKGQGAVITLYHRLPLLEKIIWESDEENKKRRSRFLLDTQMLAMHELGHVFGLLQGTGNHNPTDEELKAAHCLNECVMYWRLDSKLCEKIKNNPFCPSCLEKLKQFFIEPPSSSPPPL